MFLRNMKKYKTKSFSVYVRTSVLILAFFLSVLFRNKPQKNNATCFKIKKTNLV